MTAEAVLKMASHGELFSEPTFDGTSHVDENDCQTCFSPISLSCRSHKCTYIDCRHTLCDNCTYWMDELPFCCETCAERRLLEEIKLQLYLREERLDVHDLKRILNLLQDIEDDNDVTLPPPP